MSYETKQAILDEAGLRHRVDGTEELDGVTNGSNKIFQTAHAPLADANDDDEVDSTDVAVYVNGTKVSVASVDAATGRITLSAAPAANAEVIIAYHYTNVTDSYLAKVREETENWINDEMEGVDPVPYGEVTPTIRKIARVYAAGLLMLKEFGESTDNEEMAKQGDKKIKRAEAWLERFKALGGVTGLVDDTAFEFGAVTDPSLFTTYDQETGAFAVTSDDEFMRGFRSEPN